MLRKLGASGAFLQALSYLTLLILWVAIYPSSGATGADMMDIGKSMAFAFHHSSLLVPQYLCDVGFGVGVVLLTLALFRRFRKGAVDASLLILGTGLISGGLFFLAGVMGLVNFQNMITLANGSLSESFVSLMTVQTGLEVAAVFASGWTMFFMAYAGIKTNAWKNWLSILGYLGAAGSILMMPLLLAAPSLMGFTMLLGIFGMIFNAGIGFVLAGKNGEQTFAADLSGAI